MNKLRMAVIGVGALGRHHARILASFDDVELVGVVDARPEQGQQVATQHGTRWFSDPGQLTGLVDAAVVAVPTVYHHDVAAPLLTAGIPLMIEKPLAASLQDAERLHRLASFRKTMLQVGHIERFNPAFRMLRNRCDGPMYIRCQRVSPFTFRSTDIGVVHDLMIHDIDLVLALTGGHVESVDSFGAITIGPHEDMAMARLKTSTGVIVDLTASRMNPTVERTIQVWGRNGYLQADLQTRRVSSWKPRLAFQLNPRLIHEITASASNPMSLKDHVFGSWMLHQEVQASSEDALTMELRDFVDSIRQRRRPVVSSADAVQAMEVADRVLSAMTLWSFQNGSQPVKHPVAA